jgi:hypothetical protein
MDEQINTAARCISASLKEHERLTVPEISLMLGGKRDLLAQTLAWLLARDLIVFGRDNGNLYVMTRQSLSASV